MKSVLVLSAVSLLGACATMSEQECHVAQWEQVGYSDGVDGQPETRLSEHAKACSKAGVAPNVTEYLKGYDRGAPLFCTKDNGFHVGTYGYSHPALCRGGRYPEFEMGYRTGLEKKELLSQARDFADEAYALEQRSDELRNSLQELENTGKKDEAAFYIAKESLREQKFFLDSKARQLRAREQNLKGQASVLRP